MGLFDGISRNNFDRFDFDPFLSAIPTDRSIGNLVQHVFSFDEFAKGGVSLIKVRGRSVANKELRTRAISRLRARHGAILFPRIAVARHRDYAFHVFSITKLGIYLVAWSSRAV